MIRTRTRTSDPSIGSFSHNLEIPSPRVALLQKACQGLVRHFTRHLS